MKKNLIDRGTAILGGGALGLVTAIISTAFLTVAILGIHLSPESLAAIAAFLSFFATVITAGLLRRQIQSAERLEELKSMPYLQFVIVTQSSTATPWGVYLKNTGHGPALLIEWKFSLRGEEIALKGREGLKHIAAQYDLIDWLESFVPDKRYALGSASQESIFRMREKPKEIKYDNSAPSFINEIEKASLPKYESLDHWTKANSRLDQMMKDMDIRLTLESIFEKSKVITLHDGPERW